MQCWTHALKPNCTDKTCLLQIMHVRHIEHVWTHSMCDCKVVSTYSVARPPTQLVFFRIIMLAAFYKPVLRKLIKLIQLMFCKLFDMCVWCWFRVRRICYHIAIYSITYSNYVVFPSGKTNSPHADWINGGSVLSDCDIKYICNQCRECIR